MKRFWTFTVVGLLLAVVLPLAVIYGPHLLPPGECSSLYREYYRVPGIEASFVKGYQVNDTLFLDVTLLRAKDSADWERLVEDFGLTESVSMNPTRPSFIARRVSKDNPHQGVQTPDEPFDNLVAVPDRREIHLYCTENIQQSIDLHIHLMLKYLTTLKTQNNKKNEEKDNHPCTLRSAERIGHQLPEREIVVKIT